MFTIVTKTTERVKGQYPPEVGNLVGIFGLKRADASYGIITEVYAFDEATGYYDVKVVWYATNKKRRSHPENKRSNAARRVVACDTMDAINKHYAEA